MKVKVEDIKEDIIKFVLDEECCNENGDLVISNRGGEEEIIPKEKVREMVNNCKSMDELEKLVIVRFEVGEAMSWGEVLEELLVEE